MKPVGTMAREMSFAAKSGTATVLVDFTASGLLREMGTHDYRIGVC